MKKLPFVVFLLVIFVLALFPVSTVEADLQEAKKTPSYSTPSVATPDRPIKCNPKPNSVLYDAPNGVQIAVLKPNFVLIYEVSGSWIRVEREINSQTSFKGWLKASACT